MSLQYKAEEERIAEALKVYSLDQHRNLRELSRLFEVDYHKLRRRAKGKASKSTRPKTNQRLTEDQKAALELYIKRLDEIGQPPLISMWRAAAERIRILTSPPGMILKPLGRDFFTRYLNANPHIKKIKQKAKDVNRVVSQEQEALNDFFQKWGNLTKGLGINPMDVWNFDETGFRIGVGGSQYVVTMQLIKSAESPSETNHDFTTLVETINAAGETIPPLCILKGKSILFQHVAETDLDPNTLLGVSDSGYTNDQLALDFIQHFDKFSAQRQQGQFRILLFDGHGSHLTYKFVDYCWQKSIIPVALPSHCSHILQPLDVVVFQPLKHYHKQRVELATRDGCINYNKVEFLRSIKHIRKEAFKEQTIQSAWRKAGLWPLNPEVVLSKLKTVDQPTTPPRAPVSTAFSPPTPYTPKAIEYYARNYLYRIDLETGKFGVLTHRVTKLAKSGVVNATARTVAERDLKRLNAATKKRDKRQKKDKRVIQKGGVVYAGDARLTRAKRIEDAGKKKEAAAAQEPAKERESSIAFTTP